jgi:hypothetical protein
MRVVVAVVAVGVVGLFGVPMSLALAKVALEDWKACRTSAVRPHTPRCLRHGLEQRLVALP